MLKLIIIIIGYRVEFTWILLWNVTKKKGTKVLWCRRFIDKYSLLKLQN